MNIYSFDEMYAAYKKTLYPVSARFSTFKERVSASTQALNMKKWWRKIGTKEKKRTKDERKNGKLKIKSI